jgi:hypothetical protein
MRCRSRVIPAALLAAGTLLFAACNDDPTRTPPRIEPTISAAPALGETAARRYPGERAFREISRHVPAFAGFYFDEERQLIVQVTDLGQSTALRPAVISFLRQLVAERGNPGGPLPRIVFRQADYSFVQLSAWRESLEGPLFRLPSVVMLDLDEKRNRLTIGLATGSGRAEAEAVVRNLGIPLEAVHLLVVGPLVPLGAVAASSAGTSGCTDIREYCRPLIGGYMIKLETGGDCTLGFPVIYGGGQTGFVTASHCSVSRWDLDFTGYYQDHAGYGIVGREAVDPRGWSCDVFYKCRYSDANIVQASAVTEVGYIARLAQISNGSEPGSFLVDPERPRFRVRGTAGVVAGDLIFSVGSTTGWRHGRVQETCATLNHMWDGLWHKTLCSDASDRWSDKGDSGGPVFLWDGISDVVTLVGVHYARSSNHTFHSPIAGIQRDLGSFEARAPEFRTTPPPPGLTVQV